MSEENKGEVVIPKKPSIEKTILQLLKLRNIMSRNRPRFMRMNVWALTRLEDKWRSPRRSLDNKIRKQKKGYPPMVKIGYREPKIVRGLHPSGFEEIIVYNPKDLDDIDPKRQAIRIASTVGRRKRLEIIKRAKALGIRVLNIGIGAETI